METHWQRSYEINSLFINSQGRLGFYSLLQILQDTAVGHAQALKLGRSHMAEQNLFWVLTRQKVELQKILQMGDVIHTKTWLRIQADGMVVREFKLTDHDQQEIGKATTSWLAMSSVSRRPVKIDAYKVLAGIAQTESTNLTAPKIISHGPFNRLATFEVRNSDIDSNNHVNNTRYGQWVLDAIPFKLHRQYAVTGYEVNFLAETHLGDTIHIEQEEPAEWSVFRGIRESDQKIVFLSRLQVTELLPVR